MQYIIRYFSELMLKSKPVRARMMRQLERNLEGRLRASDIPFVMQRRWDRILLETEVVGGQRERLLEILRNTPGITRFSEVQAHPLGDMEDIAQKTLAAFSGRLDGRSFAVRCRRRGAHSFRSGDVEREVGEVLRQNSPGAVVRLSDPEVTVRLEIDEQRLFLVREVHAGLGGFPLGALGSALSLTSGGFDSTAATYLALKRGMPVHFCFFRLGGRLHERAMQEIALLLWERCAAPYPLEFVVVPFEEAVADILQNAAPPYRSLTLKRAMLRTAGRIAAEMGIGTLLTGDSVSQVSSQTLHNLEVTDRATDHLVLRPLAAANKEEIIRICREIGAEPLCARMPEHCAVMSSKPRTRAREEALLDQERACNADILEEAQHRRRHLQFREMRRLLETHSDEEEAEVLSVPLAGSAIIDVRPPEEKDRKPLRMNGRIPVLEIPFYELATQFEHLAGNTNTLYLLYCDRGVVSRIHAAHLRSQGYANVRVYRPAPP